MTIVDQKVPSSEKIIQENKQQLPSSSSTTTTQTKPQPTDNHTTTSSKSQPTSQSKQPSKPSKPLSPEALMLRELFPECKFFLYCTNSAVTDDKLARILEEYKNNVELAAQALLDGSYYDPESTDAVIVKSVYVPGLLLLTL